VELAVVVPLAGVVVVIVLVRVFSAAWVLHRSSSENKMLAAPIARGRISATA
jgi:hypothetical protein